MCVLALWETFRNPPAVLVDAEVSKLTNGLGLLLHILLCVRLPMDTEAKAGIWGMLLPAVKCALPRSKATVFVTGEAGAPLLCCRLPMLRKLAAPTAGKRVVPRSTAAMSACGDAPLEGCGDARASAGPWRYASSSNMCGREGRSATSASTRTLR